MNVALKQPHSSIRNNTKMIGVDVDSHEMCTTPTLNESMVASSTAPPSLCSSQPATIVSHFSHDPRAILSGSDTGMVGLLKLLREHVFIDAFEPVPLAERTATGITGTEALHQDHNLVESHLDQALSVNAEADTAGYLIQHREAFEPTELFNIDLAEVVPWPVVDVIPLNNDVFEPTPIAETDNTNNKTTPILHLPFPEQKPDRPLRIKGRKRTPFQEGSGSPLPSKRRRTSNDEEPRIRGYQEKLWIEQLQELIRFKELKGHCLVPHTHPENPVLSRWVKRQRYQYKLRMSGKVSTITEDRIKKLEEVGFVWDSHATTWAKRLKELKEYRDKNGDCNVPLNYVENQELAVWVKCQRRQYRLFYSTNKSSSITLDRIQVLNELGFKWKG